MSKKLQLLETLQNDRDHTGSFSITIMNFLVRLEFTFCEIRSILKKIRHLDRFKIYVKNIRQDFNHTVPR